MNPSFNIKEHKKSFWIGSAYVLGAVALVGGGLGLRRLMGIDPFAHLRGTQLSSDAYPIKFPDAHMESFQGKNLVSTANIGSINVRSDFRQFQLVNVQDGTYASDKLNFQYKANKALIDYNTKTCLGSGGVQLKNVDFDLKGNGFAYSYETKTLLAQGAVSGLLKGGEIHAENVVYSLKTGDFSTGKINWKIPPSNLNSIQDSGLPVEKNQVWNIKGTEFTHASRNGVVHDLVTNGSATDGNITIVSPYIDHNAKTDELDCKGPVKYYSAKVNLVCDQAIIFRNEKRAILTGNVVMYVKPVDQETLDTKMQVPPFAPEVPDSISATRPPAPVTEDPVNKELDKDLRSNKSIRKYPSIIRADKIIYFYAKGSRHAIITGSPEAQQELPGGRWRRVWAHNALYNGETDMMRLESEADKSQVLVKDSLGETLHFKWFEGTTRDDSEDYNAGQGGGDVISQDDELNNATADAEKKDKESAGTVSKKDKPGSTDPIKPPLKGPIGKS